MSQISQIVRVLKQQLKASGVTYAQVADALGLSEASVKRLFAEQNFTLQRLEVVCVLAGIELVDLMDKLHQERKVESLTALQEEEIAADLGLLLVAVSVIHGFSFTDLTSYYNFSEHQCIQMLAKLDRLKLLELLPGNRIKLRIAPNFRWQQNGPIQRFFLHKVAQEFFATDFAGDHEKLIVVNGLLSAATQAELQRKMEHLAEDAAELNQKDKILPIGQKHGNTLVIALRRWQYHDFLQFVKRS